MSRMDAASSGKPDVVGRFDRLDRQVVHHLEGGGDDPGLDDVGHGIAALVDGIEDAEHRLDRLGLRHDAEDRLGDHGRASPRTPPGPP